MRFEDGPPLPLVVNLPRTTQLQSFCLVLGLHLSLLLGVLGQYSLVDVEGALRAKWIP
jgi:hypothetical protein